MEKIKYNCSPDIALICQVCMLPALEKYGSFVAPLPDDTLSFTKEWNRVLLMVARRSEFFNIFGPLGKIIIKTGWANTLAKINDLTQLKHRTFHYAARYAEAYNFAKTNISKSSRLVDFGSGLSPLALHVNQSTNPFSINHIDIIPGLNDLHLETSYAMGGNAFVKNYYNTLNDFLLPDTRMLKNVTLTSLGTIVYVERDTESDGQKFLLRQIANSCKHFWVELDAENNLQVESKSVKVAGAQYSKGWSKKEITDLRLGRKKIENLNSVLRKNKFNGNDQETAATALAYKYPDVYSDIIKNDICMFVSR